MPPKVQFPGVYVSEVSYAGHTIPGVPTSVTAFIGTSASGPLQHAVPIHSFAAYEREFGQLDDRSEMSYAVSQFFVNGGTHAVIVRLPEVGDSRSSIVPVDLRAVESALAALDVVVVINLLVLPGIDDSAALAAACQYCESRRAFLLMDAPRGADTPEKVLNLVTSELVPISSHAAMYFPWIVVNDARGASATRLCAPSGSVAGLIARIDTQRGVWKAPAGIEANVKGAQSLVYALNDDDSDELNRSGVNSLRVFGSRGVVSWGARTLLGADKHASEYKYIPVRRLALFIEESVHRGTQWVAFEPNAEPTWARLRENASTFLQQLFRQGALQGTTPGQAYFVACDPTTTMESDITAGRLHMVIGFAPLRPAEFVVLKVSYQLSSPPTP